MCTPCIANVLHIRYFRDINATMGLKRVLQFCTAMQLLLVLHITRGEHLPQITNDVREMVKWEGSAPPAKDRGWGGREGFSPPAPLLCCLKPGRFTVVDFGIKEAF